MHPARTSTWPTRAQDGVSSQLHMGFVHFCCFSQVAVGELSSEAASAVFTPCIKAASAACLISSVSFLPG